MNQRERDRRAILQVVRGHSRPVLYSQVCLQAGEGLAESFLDLIGEGALVAGFPEAKPGDSGRQFWALADGSDVSPA